jgi:alkylation response protein AidB-like acyl-CoA dehydrogenase
MERAYNDIIAECRRFARREIAPLALEMDLAPDPVGLDGVWQKSHALDLPVLLIPERFGGVGYPALCAALILDTLASACAGIASVFAIHLAASAAVGKTENSEVLDYFSGDSLRPASIILPDPLDAPNLKLSQTENDITLSGESSIAGNAQLAHLFIVLDDHAQLSRRKPLYAALYRDLTGLDVTDPLDLPGLKVNSFAKLRFSDVAIKPEWLLNEAAQGIDLASAVRDIYCGFIAAMAMGVSRKALEMAVSYAKARYQYGKKIIHHQEIQRLLGGMQMKLEIGTAGYMNLFDAKAINLSYFPADARLVKAFCTDAAMEIVMDAVQIHGGYGYMHEYGLEKMMRDVKMLQLLGGQNPYQQIRAVAETL